MGVCKKWSNIVHDTPQFWTWFPATMFGPLCSDEYFKIAQRNLKDTPLSISFPSRQLVKQKRTKGRINELVPLCRSLYGCDIPIDHALFEQRLYPRLQSLTITDSLEASRHIDTVELMMPSLEILRISGVFPDQLILMSWDLRHLEMRSASMTWKSLINVLVQSPDLQILRLLRAEILIHTEPGADLPVALPQLNQIFISFQESNQLPLPTLLHAIAPTPSALTTLSIENLDSLLHGDYDFPKWVAEASTRLHSHTHM
jgi:hypothetical protein